MAVESVSDTRHGRASVVHQHLRNVQFDVTFHDQGYTAVFDRFRGVVVRVEPGTDNAEEQSPVRPVMAGGRDLMDLRIHISPRGYHVG